MNKLERIVGIVGMSAQLLSYPIGVIAVINVVEYDAVTDEFDEVKDELGHNYYSDCEERLNDYREKRNEEGFSLGKWGRDFAIDRYLEECISIHNAGII